ncbi:MAG TPA: hypothetical protein VE844_03675 [Gammaproteobacteria bacterium]|nr:hypothetical protein [Gammaproteobacteria bacterium]
MRAQVRAQEFDHVGLQRVDARQGPFQAVDGDPPLLQVDIGTLQQSDFGRTQPVAIRQQKERLVALVLNHGKQALEFLLGQEL